MIRIAALLLALAAPAWAEEPLPFAVGGGYILTDHTGALRTQADPDGMPQLLFFGYANCLQICSTALPLMADLVDDLAAENVAIRPVMITVDPQRDTVETIGPALQYIHPKFVGLTGAKPDLQVAYDAFSVEIKHIFDDPEYGPVYAHGSFIYLLNGDGRVLSLLPPVLSVEQALGIVRSHIAPAG